LVFSIIKSSKLLNAIAEEAAMKNRRVLLSSLWLFAILNYFYCDLVGMMDANLLRQYLTGTVNGLAFTPGFLLAASVYMEIPIAMVLISRIVSYRFNRTLNLIFAPVATLVQLATLFVDVPTMYYVFFSIVEIAATASIFWLALSWRRQDGR
jgi:hypothetical protein